MSPGIGRRGSGRAGLRSYNHLWPALPALSADLQPARDLRRLERQVVDELRADRHRPTVAHTEAVAKAGGGTRAVAVLRVEDRLAARALAAACWATLAPSLGMEAQVYGPHGAAGTTRWTTFERAPLRWGRPLVLVADAASFGASVRHDAVTAELERAGVEARLVDAVATTLRGLVGDVRGLPVGFHPTEVFGSAALAAGDRALRALGVPFARSSDDYRIGVRGPDEASEAVEVLGRALDPLGVTLSGDKARAVPFDRWQGELADRAGAADRAWELLGRPFDQALLRSRPGRSVRRALRRVRPRPEDPGAVDLLEVATARRDPEVLDALPGLVAADPVVVPLVAAYLRAVHGHPGAAAAAVRVLGAAELGSQRAWTYRSLAGPGRRPEPAVGDHARADVAEPERSWSAAIEAVQLLRRWGDPCPVDWPDPPPGYERDVAVLRSGRTISSAIA